MKPPFITSASNSEQKPLHLPSLARKLPDDWRWMRLDEVCSGIFDCPHSTPVLTAEGTFLARSQDILNGVFRSEAAARVSDETHSERTVRAEPTYGDLLYSREGTYFGIAAEVPKDARVCLGQRMVLLRPDATRVNFRFLRYWLNSPVLAAHIHGHRDGTVAERLNLPTIRGLPIPVPPMSQQAFIAFVLGDLDDKIESNRRMNDTFEATARAIFKSWFVDFDPVRAKAEGRQPPGMEAATAALFPDSFEDSRLGETPKGWRVGKLGEVASLNRESVNPSLFPDEVFDHYSLPAFDEGRWPKQESGAQIKSNKSLVPPNSVLLSKLNPRFPRVWLPSLSNDKRSIASTEFLVTSAREPFNREYLFGLFTSQSFFAVFATLVTGTSSSHQRVRAEFLHEMDAVIPSQECIASFSRTTGPLYARLIANLSDSRTLSAIRDTLLPKLISGEVRVRAADNRVETVA